MADETMREELDESGREERARRLSELPSHRIAFEDLEFLHRDQLRPIRLQLEHLKPEIAMREEGVGSTIVVFGSARVPSPETAQEHLREARAAAEARPDDERAQRDLRRAERQCDRVSYYQEARRFARIVSENCQTDLRCECVITTGGGPGIMEAANRGAWEIGAKTVGLNIEIPHEQVPNPYITPELCLRFHYFAMRKMHMLLRARALVIFPGGFGTLDELFDAITLIQTGKMDPIPVVLLGEEYWDDVIDFEVMVEQGTISPEDVDIMTWADSAEDAWRVIREFYDGVDPSPGGGYDDLDDDAGSLPGD